MSRLLVLGTTQEAVVNTFGYNIAASQQRRMGQYSAIGWKTGETFRPQIASLLESWNAETAIASDPQLYITAYFSASRIVIRN